MDVSEAKVMPVPQADHPLASALLLRTLRLNCLTAAYMDLWAELYDPVWPLAESWAVDWSGLSPLGAVGPMWTRNTPLRTHCARRAALVEIDALVSVWLGIHADELIAIYLSRYPQLVDYESEMWFDADGRRLAGNFNQYGFGQTKEHFEQLKAYFDDPERNEVPHGYTAPFYSADRENEYRQAHAVFSERLQRAMDDGWEPS